MTQYPLENESIQSKWIYFSLFILTYILNHNRLEIISYKQNKIVPVSTVCQFLVNLMVKDIRHLVSYRRAEGDACCHQSCIVQSASYTRAVEYEAKMGNKNESQLDQLIPKQ